MPWPCQVPQIASSGVLSGPPWRAGTPSRTLQQRGSGEGRGETTEGSSKSPLSIDWLHAGAEIQSQQLLPNLGNQISVISRGVGGMGAWHNCSFHFDFRGIHTGSTLSHPPHPPTNP